MASAPASRTNDIEPMSGLRRLVRYSDVALAAGVVAIVALMILPVPSHVLDILITTNIALALTILLVSSTSRSRSSSRLFPPCSYWQHFSA